MLTWELVSVGQLASGAGAAGHAAGDWAPPSPRVALVRGCGGTVCGQCQQLVIIFS
jgi:hypothetical protein